MKPIKNVQIGAIGGVTAAGAIAWAANKFGELAMTADDMVMFQVLIGIIVTPLATWWFKKWAEINA